MKVYACPAEIPEPKYDYRNFNSKQFQEVEAAHKAQLKSWLQDKGYNGKNTGEIVRFPVADGYAQYMLGDKGKGGILIHLPYGDAWNYRDAEYLPKKVILERIERDKKLQELFSR